MTLISEITPIYAIANQKCEFTVQHKLTQTKKYKLTVYFILKQTLLCEITGNFE